MSERTAVQRPMLKYADEIGWTLLSQEEALEKRGNDQSLFFSEILETQLLKLNPAILNPNNVGDVIRQLNLLNPGIEGNQQAMRFFRGEQSVFIPEENRELNIKLIDFDRIDNNAFHVTEEWRHKGVRFANRADVMFLINGIPVALVETKNESKPDGLTIGIDQVRRYHRETPEMLTTAQVYDVTELVNFYYGVTWNTSRKNIFNWKDEMPLPPEGHATYEHKVKTFFNRERFLKILKDYIVFLTTEQDELTKVILRQHQTRAVEKVLDRALDPTKRHGLIWHTQGSGKTLTMITVAAKLLHDAGTTEKPTVLMLIDRNELETQLTKNIASYGIQNPKIAKTKRELQDILASDFRGLVVSMIHKFDDIPANINTRSSVIVLVDEAHRTTGGDLGNFLMGALPNATYIGFTGTPIDRISKGKGTFKVFGCDDEKGFLDKYSIAESIEDGTTVALNYALAPSELRVDKEALEKHFLSKAEAEGVSDIEELNAILERAVELKEMMKTDTRVEAIARFVAEHYKSTVEPMGFKAFLVAVDREACTFYKKALDKYLPPEYSEVVYSPAHNDREHLKEFHRTYDDEIDIRKRFTKRDQLPKILIVTEKLLTGFDAPILYAMYLDKPMRDHVLLQTIARVNRPYEYENEETKIIKPYGFVLDFVGIFENLEKALSFDSDVVASVIQNIDVLKNLFATMMKEAAPQYLEWAKGWDDKAKDRAIEHFADKERRETFFKFYRNIQNLYDVISPDAFLRPYIEDFQSLASLFGLIRNAYSENPYVDKELTEKTKQLLREHTSFGRLEMPGAIHQLGAEELRMISDSGSSDTTKILNLKKVLGSTVQTEGGSKPFLISIGDRAERLAEAYENKQLTTQQMLLALEELSEEVVQAEEERKSLGLENNSYSIYVALKPVLSDVTPDQAKLIDQLFGQYPDYQWNALEEKKLRTELYKAMNPWVGAHKVVDVAKMLLRIQRV